MIRAAVVTIAPTDGVLLVDKPAGMTSHDVVAVARRALHIRRIGHTGTLDPFATGLLVLLVGRATRLLPYVEGEPKVYEATITFGAETDTDDVTGEVVRQAPLPAVDAVDRGIAALTGEILQLPPNYSAKQVGGKRAYVAARAGAPIELPPARVVVHSWLVRARTASTLDVTITCGGGTFIRALARDLGRQAGSAAHLAALRRTRTGVFDVSGATSVDDLRLGGPVALTAVRSIMPSAATQRLAGDELRRVRHGNAIDARVSAPVVALIDDSDEMVAVAQREGDSLRPRVVLLDD